MKIIRIELGEEVKRHGRWRWNCPEYGVEGVSRQPLLDGCRAIQRAGGDAKALVGLFWPGKTEPSLTCTVEVGARLTVDETISPQFRKWRPLDRSVFDE